MRLKTPSNMLLTGILAVGLAGCGATADAEPESDSGAQTENPALTAAGDTVEEGLAELVSSGALVGGEAVLQEGSAVADVTAGVGDIDTEDPYPEAGHIRVASVTKAFTSAMVLQLVDEGTVDLDGTVDDYLPGVLSGDGIEPDKITVRQLLRHESGLPEIAEPDDPAATYTPSELIALIGSQPAQFPPGEQMRYTNTNYVLAGMLIEKITGNAYVDELDQRIVQPLGLEDTTLPAPGDRTLPDPAPRGYQLVDGELADATEQEPSVLYASGGLVSTGADLNRFFTALLAGEVVAPELLDAMQETVPMTDVPGVDYGLGVMRLPVSCDATVWGQAGDIPGFSTMTGTDGKRSVSLMLNQSPGGDLGPQNLLALLDSALC